MSFSGDVATFILIVLGIHLFSSTWTTYLPMQCASHMIHPTCRRMKTLSMSTKVMCLTMSSHDVFDEDAKTVSLRTMEQVFIVYSTVLFVVLHTVQYSSELRIVCCVAHSCGWLLGYSTVQ